jgi:superfamily II DNA or RNA helicase
MERLSARGAVLLAARKRLTAAARDVALWARRAKRRPAPREAELADDVLAWRGRRSKLRSPARPPRLSSCEYEIRASPRTLVARGRASATGREHTLELPYPALATAPLACGCGAPDCAHLAELLDSVIDLLAEPTGAERAALAAPGGPPTWAAWLGALGDEEAAAGGDEGRELLWWSVRASGAHLAVLPLVQAPADGLARAPQALPVRRLLDEPTRCALPADRAAATALVAGGEGAPVRALRELIGHPRVCREGELAERVRVSLESLELVVEELDGGELSLGFAVDGRAVEPTALFGDSPPGACAALVDDDERRVRVVELTPGAASVVAQVSELEGPLPAEARDELVSRAHRLEARLPVRLPASLEGPEVEADGRMVLRLSPTRGGDVLVRLRARPAPAGALYPPGEGAEVVGGTRDGQRVRVARRRDLERSAAAALRDALELGGREAAEPWAWFVDEQRALEVAALFAERDDVDLEWPEGPALRVIEEARLPSLHVRIGARRDWFSLDGEYDVGEQQVQLHLLLDAARAGRRWVPVRPGEFLSLPEEMSERLALLAASVERRDSELLVPALAAPALEELLEGAELEDTPAAWDEVCARARSAGDDEVELPADLRAELRPYQRTGFEWMARLCSWGAGACLADDMGLGKTLQTLALLLHRSSEGPALVVAPTSVCAGWRAEAARFAPALRVLVAGDDQLPVSLSSLGDGDVLVTSYGRMTREVDTLARVDFGTLVLDEAQAIKNPTAQRAGAARKLNARARIALSGTPVENHLGELWSVFSVVCPGLLGSYERFRSRFQQPIERDADPTAEDALGALVRPFLLRRTKEAVAPELPARTEVVERVPLSEAERAMYEAARRRAFLALPEGELLSEAARMDVLAALTRLRRLACHPRLFDPASQVASSKMSRVLELLEEATSGEHKALVFSQFTSHLALLREHLDAAGTPYLYLDGQTPPADRQAAVERFQAGAAPLFLISLRAGGTGLTLTAADYVLHLDPWWNPALEDQATDRAYRIGQKRPVTVYRLISEGTIEERVLELHRDKRELAASILDGSGGPRASVAELASLLDTSREVAWAAAKADSTHSQS